MILIDGDILVYKYACTNQTKIDWGDDCQSITTNEARAFDTIRELIYKWTERLRANEVRVCLSDASVNWRKQVFPDYKSNRKAVERPLLYDSIRQMLQDEYTSFLIPTLEADDVMGILQTRKLPHETVIVSADKDMKTIPGLLFNPDKMKKPVRITPKAADYWHYLQTLMGDTTDGFKGCPGIGPVKAREILLDAEQHKINPWLAICAAYWNKGLTPRDALVQAQIARICRNENYDVERKEVIPWMPKLSI